MPLKNFFSVRILDPKKCSSVFRTKDPGRKGGLQITFCIPKGADVSTTVSLSEWRRFRKTQRFLVEKTNVKQCTRDGERSLCPVNDRGKREIASIEKRHGTIIGMPGGKSYEFTTTDPKP